jgi:hypothetical protein
MTKSVVLGLRVVPLNFTITRLLRPLTQRPFVCSFPCLKCPRRISNIHWLVTRKGGEKPRSNFLCTRATSVFVCFCRLTSAERKVSVAVAAAGVRSIAREMGWPLLANLSKF